MPSSSSTVSTLLTTTNLYVVNDVLIKCLPVVVLQRSADGESLTMSQQDAQPEVLTTAGSELNNALNNPFFGML